MLLGIVTVDAVNVALVAPAGTVTVAGTVTFGLDETSVTTAPSGPATPFRVTRPVDAFPPTTTFGVNDTAVGIDGVIVRLLFGYTHLPLQKVQQLPLRTQPMSVQMC